MDAIAGHLRSLYKWSEAIKQSQEITFYFEIKFIVYQIFYCYMLCCIEFWNSMQEM